jgi:hypothetical protein
MSVYNKTNSTTHPIPYGVPQGAILSPSLYNFFTADSPQSNECETATFADDTAIFVSDGNPNIVCTALQGHLVNCSTYFKTQAIYFTRCWAARKLPATNISIGGHPISWSTEENTLGLPSTRDSLLPVTPPSLAKNLDKAFRILHSFFNRKSRLK